MKVAVDTETTGLDIRHGCLPFIVSSCDEKGALRVWEWDVDPMTRVPRVPSRERRQLTTFLQKKKIIYHNAKFDTLVLEAINVIKADSNYWKNVDDTIIMSHVSYSAGQHGLKPLAERLLDVSVEDQKDLQKAVNDARRYGRKHGWRIAAANDPHFPAVNKLNGKNTGWQMDMWLPRAVAKAENYPKDHPWWSVACKYATIDAERTMGLYYVFKEEILDQGLWDNYDVRRSLLEITYRMQQRGVPVHKKKLDEAVIYYGREAARAKITCLRLADQKFDNLNSPKQLQGILYGHFNFKPVKTTPTGAWSTDADTLRQLELQVSPRSKKATFLRNLMESRKYTKAVEYLTSYKACGFPIGKQVHKETPKLSWATREAKSLPWLILHSNFNITGTATTRFSSTDPNTQNISKQETFNLRKIFVPLPHREYYSIDYDNIEFRIFGYECGDKELIKAFEAGLSMHLVIAEVLHPKKFAKLGPDKFKKTETYRWIKNGNFALIYGASQKKANATYRVDGAYDLIRKKLPKIDGFIKEKYEEGREQGYVTTLGGYRLIIPKREPHKAANYFVQGSAGWAMTLALIRVHKYLKILGPDYYMNMTIHDEICFDFPKKKTNTRHIKKIKKLMELSGDDLGVPTPASIDRWDKSWADEVSL